MRIQKRLKGMLELIPPWGIENSNNALYTSCKPHPKHYCEDDDDHDDNDDDDDDDDDDDGIRESASESEAS